MGINFSLLWVNLLALPSIQIFFLLHNLKFLQNLSWLSIWNYKLQKVRVFIALLLIVFMYECCSNNFKCLKSKSSTSLFLVFLTHRSLLQNLLCEIWNRSEIPFRFYSEESKDNFEKYIFQKDLTKKMIKLTQSITQV